MLKGTHHSEETKRKIGLASKGQIENLYLFKGSGYHTNYHRFLRKCVREMLCEGIV